MTLTGLSQDVLDRLHRFVRLWRTLGWDVYDLDNAIANLQSGTPAGLGQLNGQLLRQLAAAQWAAKAYSLPVPAAVALFAPTPTAVTIATRDVPTLPGDDDRYSLYHDLFENLTVLNPPDPIFALNPQGTEIAAIGTGPKLADHAPALVAAFQISQSELTAAITTFTDGALTLANLSTLYRIALLVTALGITVAELISLLAFTEAELATPPGYEVVHPFDGTRPESLAAFASIYATIAPSGLSIEQVDYIVRGVDTGAGAEVAPDPVAVGTVLLTLYTGLGKIVSANAFSPDPTGTATRKALSALLLTADVNTAMAILDGSTTLSLADQTTFVTSTLGKYIDGAAADTNLVGGAALPAGQQRFEYVLKAVLAYQITYLSKGLIVQTLAQQLGLASQTTALLLESWFPSFSTPGAFLITDFLALPGKTLADPTKPITPTTTGFEAYFTAYASLAKVSSLITALRLTRRRRLLVGERPESQQGWLDPTALPTTPQADAGGRFHSLARLIDAAHVRDRVPIPNASFATLFTPAATMTKAAYLDSLATATRWPAASLAVLCGDPTNNADLGELSLNYPDDYTHERALSQLLPCESLIAQTGIPADVKTWIANDIDSTTADAIKQSVKANYSDQQWLTLAKQLRDPLAAGAARRARRLPARVASSRRRLPLARSRRRVRLFPHRRRDVRLHGDLADRAGDRRGPAVRPALLPRARAGRHRRRERRQRLAAMAVDEPVPRLAGEPRGVPVAGELDRPDPARRRPRRSSPISSRTSSRAT